MIDHETSMLATLVDDVEPFRTALPTEPILSKRPPERLQSLIDFGAVDRLLSDHALRYPFIEMIKDGARLPRERFLTGPVGQPNGISELANLTLVAGELEGGATLVLNDLHFTWRPIADTCRRLAYEIGMPVHANAYLTPRRSQGFDHHHDTHSVFIVQTEGRKTWQLYRPFLPFPLERHAWPRQVLPPEEWHRLRETPPDHEFVLEPGNVLWIPRGWIHNVFSGDEPSLHLTVGIAETSRYSIVPTLIDALTDEERFRHDLPPRFARSRGSVEDAVRSVLRDLAEWAGRADVSELATRVLGAQRARFLPAPSRPISAVLPGDRDLPGAVAVRPEVIAGVDRTDEGTTLHLGDRVLRFTGTAAAVLERLLGASGKRVTLGALTAAEPAAAVEAAVRTLLAEGVLVPDDDAFAEVSTSSEVRARAEASTPAEGSARAERSVRAEESTSPEGSARAERGARAERSGVAAGNAPADGKALLEGAPLLGGASVPDGGACTGEARERAAR
ncbi:hypothetical protein GCM10023196_023290 [Actinoallomurus vinaceus]|uniref:JmjC domain-containing protein n=1 Tax=Actinoallomurus vinaceus TaxID=1080074 RepID=A0ABP8U7C1_9ACTN